MGNDYLPPHLAARLRKAQSSSNNTPTPDLKDATNTTRFTPSPSPVFNGKNASSEAPCEVASESGELAVVPFKAGSKDTTPSERRLQRHVKLMEDELDELHARCATLENENEQLNQTVTDQNDRLLALDEVTELKVLATALKINNEELERDVLSQKRVLSEQAEQMKKKDQELSRRDEQLREEQDKLRDIEAQLAEKDRQLDEAKQRTASTAPSANEEQESVPTPASALKLDKEQLDSVLATFQKSYADIQAQAESKAEKRVEDVIGKLNDNQNNLVGRIQSLENRSVETNDQYDAVPMESLSGQTLRDLQTKLAALETSLNVVQPQSNKDHDKIEALAARLVVVEDDLKKDNNSLTSGASEGGKQGNILKSFRADMLRQISSERKIDDSKNRDELKGFFLALNHKFPDDDDVRIRRGPFEGTRDELTALRNRILRRLATFDNVRMQEKALSITTAGL